MTRFAWGTALALVLQLAGAPAFAAPVSLTITNTGDVTMECRIVAGSTPAQLRRGRTVVKAIVKPGESKAYAQPAGDYTLFPGKYMEQGTRTLAFYPFRLKEGQALTIAVSRGARPVFKGVAQRINIDAKPTHR